jgi:hypothetical protein
MRLPNNGPCLREDRPTAPTMTPPAPLMTTQTTQPLADATALPPQPRLTYPREAACSRPVELRARAVPAGLLPVCARDGRSFAQATVFPVPPEDVARTTLNACAHTMPHVPSSMRGRWSALLLRWEVDAAWRLAYAHVTHSKVEYLTALDVGPSLVLRGAAGTAEVRDRIQLAEEADWEGLARLVTAQTAAHERRNRNNVRANGKASAIRRATRLMEEGCVARAVRALANASDDRQTCITNTTDTHRNQSTTTSSARKADETTLAALRRLFPAEPANPPHPDASVRAPPTAPIVEVAPLPDPRTLGALCLPPETWSDVRTATVAAAAARAAHARAQDSADVTANAIGQAANSANAHDPAAVATCPWSSAVAEALRSRGRLTAPGPLGLRAEHLREAASIRVHRDAHLQALAHVADTICAGTFPAGQRDSRLFAVPKKSPGAFRPIGAGECIRNIACALACTALVRCIEADAARRGQLGMSSTGTQRAARRVRSLADAGYAILSVDIVNAFNEILRATILQSLPLDAPGRALALALYGGTSTMRMSGRSGTIDCTRGVVQGCPLAAALFGHALVRGPVHAAVTELAERGIVASPDVPIDGAPQEAHAQADAFFVFFADDGHIAARGPNRWATLNAIGEALERHFLAAGMRIAVGPQKTAVLSASEHDSPPADSWIARNASTVDCLRCLGSPVSRRLDPEPARVAVAAAVHEARTVTACICELPNPHHVLTALRLAGCWSRVDYLVSTTPRALIDPDLIADVEATDMRVLCAALGPYGDELDATGWLQASLPIALGGLGIRRASAEARTAQDRAARQTRALERGDGAAYTAAVADGRRSRGDDARRILAGILATSAPAQDAWRRGLAADGGSGSAWVAATSNRALGTWEQADLFSAALAERLQLRLFGNAITEDAPCPARCAARSIRCDAQGTHTLGCTATLVPRHNLIRDRIWAFLAQHLGRGNLWHEAHCANDGTPRKVREGDRPGDIAYRAPGNSQWIFLDVGVRSLRSDLLNSARSDPRVLARDIYDEKMRTVGLAVRRTGAQFFPIAFGAHGVIDPRSLAVLRAAALTADRLCDRDPVSGQPALQRDLLQRVTGSVAIGNAIGIARTRENIPALPSRPHHLSDAHVRDVTIRSHAMQREFLRASSGAPPDHRQGLSSGPTAADAGQNDPQAASCLPLHGGRRQAHAADFVHDERQTPPHLGTTPSPSLMLNSPLLPPAVWGGQSGNALAPERAECMPMQPASGQPVPHIAQATTGSTTAGGSGSPHPVQRAIPADVSSLPRRSGPTVVRTFSHRLQ